MEHDKKINQKHLIISGLITKYQEKCAATKMEEKPPSTSTPDP
jgi:hypothetical protein